MDFFGQSGSKKSAPARGTARAPKPSSTVVTTTTKVRVATPSARLPNAVSAPKHNALPAAVQMRIQQNKREQQAAAAESEKLNMTSAARTVTQAKRVRRSSSHAPSSSRQRLNAESDDEPPVLRVRSKSPSVFHYEVPRQITRDHDYDPLTPDLRAKQRPHAKSSQSLVLESRAVYCPCTCTRTDSVFEGLEAQPVVHLEYPAPDCSEPFLLLVPKDVDEYDPVSDLLRAVAAMVAHYVPPSERDRFGALEDLETGSNAGLPLDKASRAIRAESCDSVSRSSTPSSAPGDDSHGGAASTSSSRVSASILRSFTKARNRRDGPLFVQTVSRFNAAICELRASGALRQHIGEVGARQGVPEDVWRTIQEQVYAREAAPHVDFLKQYKSFSDHVYGEMLPPFVSEIARIAQLGPSSVMVDLGSGIGNVLLQVSLQTGCVAYGCECMTAPSSLAESQILEAVHRWRMWDIAGGPLIDEQCEDFTEPKRVRDFLRRADAILVNKCVV